MTRSSQGPGVREIAGRDFSQNRIGIVVAEWNDGITESLYSSAVDALLSRGISKENIVRKNVPGSFELSLGAQRMASDSYDVVICLGCIVQGETRHFEFICQSVVQGLKDVALKFNKPVIFGVLTTDTYQQALDRAGGKHGNKGEEVALTALKMIQL